MPVINKLVIYTPYLSTQIRISCKQLNVSTEYCDLMLTFLVIIYRTLLHENVFSHMSQNMLDEVFNVT